MPRFIRVLVYECDDEFMKHTAEHRGVKGGYTTPHGNSIKEIVIGDADIIELFNEYKEAELTDDEVVEITKIAEDEGIIT